MRFKILVEGTSDVEAVNVILSRSLGLKPKKDFLVISHIGKGNLPYKGYRPDYETLLYELPRTLRGLAEEDVCVVVLVDADSDNCVGLKKEIMDMYDSLDRKPEQFLVRIAVEETESWFVADPDAVLSAYPMANVSLFRDIPPDAAVGAWEQLAKALGRKPAACKRKKKSWARKIAPHLKLDPPYSPSLAVFLKGIEERM